MLPAEFNGTGTLSLFVGNTGSSDITVVPGQEMLVNITLSRGVPNNVDPLAAISGAGAQWFTWSYNPGIRTYTGVQNQTIPGDLNFTVSEEIVIDYRVAENSFVTQTPQNGFNSNITPPGYTNDSNATNDDTISNYTYVQAFDYGDAPAPYLAARHEINLSGGSGAYTAYMYLGSSVDPEAVNQASTGADGDDNNQTGGLNVDDEDGVTFPTLIPGETVIIPVVATLVPTTGVAFLNGWIDWNGDGDFTDPGEQLLASPGVFLSSSGIQNLMVTVPANAVLGTTYARFRIAGAPPTSSGSATSGEVEDYEIEIGKAATFAGFLAQNAALFGLDDNVPPGVPATNPLTGVVNPGASDPSNDDFGTPGDPNPGLTGNVDGDVYNNLLEFALCFDPGSGAKVFPDGTPNEGFHLELNGGVLDAKFSRPTNVADVTYVLQSSTDGQAWADVDATAITTTTAGPVIGSTTVCFADVISEVGTAGLLRLKVNAGTGGAAGTFVTGPVGWQMATITDFCQTYSDPLLEPCLVTGTVTGVAGQVLDLSQAAGTQSLATRLEVGKNYYLEVMSGDNAGHIFDIASFTANSLTLATDSDLCALSAPYSTQLTVPTDLAGDMFVIREHKTLEGLFPIDDIDTTGTVEGFASGLNTTDAGVLLRYNRAGGLESYVASSPGGGIDTWVASTTVGGPDNILPPGEGIFVHNLLGSASFDILQYGEVRTNQLVVPLKEGYNFVGAAHPIVSQSIDGGASDTTSRLMNADDTGGKFVFDGSGARSLADQVQFWQDDTAIDAASAHICYDMIFYLRNLSGTVDQWSVGGTPVPTNEEVKPLFQPTRSAMYYLQKDDLLEYFIPSPISNTVN